MGQGDVPIVDGHLDLAENATIFGRDPSLEVSAIRAQEGRQSNEAMVSLPELKKGHVAVALATVTPGFRLEDVPARFEPRSAIYTSCREAEAQALAQIELYNRWERAGLARVIKSVNDLDDHLELWKTDKALGLVLLMESADAIVEIGDLPAWWERGLRIIGLTFGDTQYGVGVAGGSTEEKAGGLTEKGIELLQGMAAQGLVWDISHLTEMGVWQGFDLGFPRVCASHANARKLVPTSRHLSDQVIAEIAGRDGAIGLVLYNGFLDANWRQDRTVEVSLYRQFRAQAEYIAGIAGWSHVGVGSDLDGGFGRKEGPRELDSIADLYKIGQAVPEPVSRGVLSDNWLSFLRRSLPRGAQA